MVLNAEMLFVVMPLIHQIMIHMRNVMHSIPHALLWVRLDSKDVWRSTRLVRVISNHTNVINLRILSNAFGLMMVAIRSPVWHVEISKYPSIMMPIAVAFYPIANRMLLKLGVLVRHAQITVIQIRLIVKHWVDALLMLISINALLNRIHVQHIVLIPLNANTPKKETV